MRVMREEGWSRWTSVGLGVALPLVLGGAVVVVFNVVGGSLAQAVWTVGAGAGWGGCSFATGWWIALRRRERVGVEVGAALAPVVKELRHLRRVVAHGNLVDEHAKTRVHPRRIAPPSDRAKTVALPYAQVREALR